MNNWQKACEYIDNNENFSVQDIINLGIKDSAAAQYRYYLKRAEYIEGVTRGHYRRVKPIGLVSLESVKMAGFDLELEKGAA